MNYTAIGRLQRAFGMDIVIEPHQVLIAVGTDTDFDRLDKIAT